MQVQQRGWPLSFLSHSCRGKTLFITTRGIPEKSPQGTLLPFCGSMAKGKQASTHTILSAHPFLLYWLQGFSIALV